MAQEEKSNDLKHGVFTQVNFYKNKTTSFF